MTKLLPIARYLLGAAFLVFGIDGFLHFIPIPPARPPAEQLIGALIQTGYFFQMVKCIEIACGAMLLTNYLVPLALVLLTPLLVGITSVHLFLNPEGLGLMVVLLGLHAFLVHGYFPYFAPLLTVRAIPGATTGRQPVGPISSANLNAR